MKQPAAVQSGRRPMPVILKVLTGICFAMALCLVVAAIPVPHMHYEINGHDVSYADFWKLGGGPLFVVAGIVLPLSGFGFVNRKHWGRYLCTGFFVIGSLFQFFAGLFIPVYKTDASVQLSYAVFVAVLVWYLFCKQSVKEYFSEQVG